MGGEPQRMARTQPTLAAAERLPPADEWRQPRVDQVESRSAAAELLGQVELLREEVAQLKLRLKGTQEELEKTRASEVHLKRALNLAADRIHTAQEETAEARRQRDLMQEEVNDIRHRFETDQIMRYKKKKIALDRQAAPQTHPLDRHIS